MTTGSGHSGTGQAALNRRNFCANFSQIAGNGTCAAAQFKHTRSRLDIKRPQQAVPGAAKVIASRPIINLLK